MAKYEISVSEYRQFTFVPAVTSWKQKLAWAISLSLLITSLVVGQYAFSAVWSLLLVFVYVTFYRFVPRSQLDRLSNNPFALGPFEVEFSDEAYTVRVRDSVLRLSKEDLGRVNDMDDHYRLDHKSMCVLYVPKRALSESEIGVIESYRKDFPGHPENEDVPEY